MEPVAGMTAYEVIDLLHSIANRVDVQWGLFITIHMALFGGLIYIDRRIKFREKILAAILYSGFAYLNYEVVLAQFEQLLAAYLQVAELATEPRYKDNILVQHFAGRVETLSDLPFEMLAIGIHLILFALVILSLIYHVPEHKPQPPGQV